MVHLFKYILLKNFFVLLSFFFLFNNLNPEYQLPVCPEQKILILVGDQYVTKIT